MTDTNVFQVSTKGRWARRPQRDGGVMHIQSEDRSDRISALMFSGTMPPQLPVLIALIQILLGCDRRRRIRAPFGAL